MKFHRRNWICAALLITVWIISIVFKFHSRTATSKTKYRLKFGPKTKNALCRNCIDVGRYKKILAPENSVKIKYDAVLLVMSSHRKDAWERREVIRRTWANTSIYLPLMIQCVFVLGRCNTGNKTAIIEESRSHKDILMLDFIDSYQNLSVKTLTSLSWATQNYVSDVIIKSDDDVILNVTRILKLFHYHKHTQFDGLMGGNKIILGSCRSNVIPERNPNRPYYLSEKYYPPRELPRFCFGTTYIVNREAVESILNQTSRTAVVPAEDISLGILAKASGDIKMIDVVNWRIWFSKLLTRNDYRKYDTVHLLNPTEMSHVWSTFYSSGCPGQRMWSYWSKSMSKECMELWHSQRLVKSQRCMKMLEFKNTFISEDCRKKMNL